MLQKAILFAREQAAHSTTKWAQSCYYSLLYLTYQLNLEEEMNSNTISFQ